MLVRVYEHGTVTIPEELRDGLDEDSLLEVVRRGDGVIELRPQGAIDADQRWYWSARWQQMEHEARADYTASRFRTYDNVEAFLAGLDADTRTAGLPLDFCAIGSAL